MIMLQKGVCKRGQAKRWPNTRKRLPKIDRKVPKSDRKKCEWPTPSAYPIAARWKIYRLGTLVTKFGGGILIPWVMISLRPSQNTSAHTGSVLRAHTGSVLREREREKERERERKRERERYPRCLEPNSFQQKATSIVALSSPPNRLSADIFRVTKKCHSARAARQLKSRCKAEFESVLSVATFSWSLLGISVRITHFNVNVQNHVS